MNNVLTVEITDFERMVKKNQDLASRDKINLFRFFFFLKNAITKYRKLAEN